MGTSRTAASGRRRFGKRRVGAASTKCPCPVRIHIHLDANRDGLVDDRWWLNGGWKPGKGKLGAVVLCNCDDEDGDKAEDHRNDKIDGADDNADIAPFHLRKHPKDEPAPAGWKVVVEVLGGHESLFRIFDNEKAAGKELLGPVKGKSFRITDLSPKEWKYGMEVNQYPGRIKDPALPGGVRPITNEWDGYVMVKLSLLDDRDVVRDSEQAKVRAAPWLIFTHMDPTEKVYVAETGDNGPFVTALEGAAGVPVEKWGTGDRWMQDVMEIGFSTLPKAAGATDLHVPAAIRTTNDRDLVPLVEDRILGKNYGMYDTRNTVVYDAADPTSDFSSLDSFGNLECVPPFKHPKTKKDYKFGRIIYGHSTGTKPSMRETVPEFLKAQKVQFPFKVDTGWLQVGHIDEVLTFVPNASSKWGFTPVLASPSLALSILRAPGVPGTTPIFVGVDFATMSPRARPNYSKRTVAEVLDETTTPNIVRASNAAQTKIDQIKEDLKREIGFVDSDFAHLPILFAQDRVNECIAYTAGAVNMLVVTSGPTTRAGARTAKLCVPKPFGPIVGGTCLFEKATTDALTALGATFEIIDDFNTYHVLQGEIHCGSNSKRKGATDRFWWEQAGI